MLAVGLGNVMKTRDGEPLSGGASAASDFAGVGNAVAPAAHAAGLAAGNPYADCPSATPAYQPPYSAPAANPAPWNGTTQTYATGGAVESAYRESDVIETLPHRVRDALFDPATTLFGRVLVIK